MGDYIEHGHVYIYAAIRECFFRVAVRSRMQNRPLLLDQHQCNSPPTTSRIVATES